MTSQADRIGVALIGAGMIAKTHVAAVSDLRSGLRLDAVMSRTPDRAKYLAQHYAGAAPSFTTDLSQITNDPNIQIAIVATPPNVRIDLIKSLAKAGKHILLEKPVARNLPEATQVVEICEQAGVTLGLLFQHRKRAASVAAAKHIARDRFGKLGHVEITAPLWRDQTYYDELGRGTYERDGGGVMLTQAIHTIDLALSLTGPIVSVQAMTATTPLHDMESEDFAVAGIRLASGAVGSFVTSTASFPQQPETITLHFERASLHLGKDDLAIHWRDGRVESETFDRGCAEDKGPVPNNHALHQTMIANFAEAIANNRAPLVTGRAALASHQFIQAIETSSRTGQVVEV